MVDENPERGKEGVGRRIYSKRVSLILVFFLLALTEGLAAFIGQYGNSVSISLVFPPHPFPFWYTFNQTLGMSLLSVITNLVFPVSSFVVLYTVGDRIQLKENIPLLSLTISLGGVIGFGIGYTAGLLVFPPASYVGRFNPLPEIEAANGVAAIIFRGIFAFAVGFSAILLKQVRTKAAWIV